MAIRLVPMQVRFWMSASGRVPVRDFLSELSREDRHRVGVDLGKVQFGWPLGMPLVRALGDGLWEQRSSLPSKRELRLLFSVDDESLALLHAFVKTSQKSPPRELELARQRLKELRR